MLRAPTTYMDRVIESSWPDSTSHPGEAASAIKRYEGRNYQLRLSE